MTAAFQRKLHARELTPISEEELGGPGWASQGAAFGDGGGDASGGDPSQAAGGDASQGGGPWGSQAPEYKAEQAGAWWAGTQR